MLLSYLLCVIAGAYFHGQELSRHSRKPQPLEPFQELLGGNAACHLSAVDNFRASAVLAASVQPPS